MYVIFPLSRKSYWVSQADSKTVRGEGANHGITDVLILLENLVPALKSSNNGQSPPLTASPSSLKAAIEAYENEMIARTAPAVLTSRRACLDAHDYKRINGDSPLISRRAMVVVPEE